MASSFQVHIPPSEILSFIMNPLRAGLSAPVPKRLCRYSSSSTLSSAAYSTGQARLQGDGVLRATKLPDMPPPTKSTDIKAASSTIKDHETSTIATNRNHPPPQRALAGAHQDTPPGRDRSKDPRLPRSVQAIYLKPLRRKAEFGVPSCDLQLRSYNVRNVEFFADFALRAAYYLGLPAAGPVPLPRITERWTVPRSNFIFKKSQENFERITLRRLVQIQDGHPETVELWLAFLRKHAYYGVGMKANVWQHEKLGVGKTMDVSLENLKRTMGPNWAHFGRRKTLETSERAYEMMRGGSFTQVMETPASSV